MPETPEQLYERVKDALRMPPVEEWETFPFDGELRPRELLPPVGEEEIRALYLRYWIEAEARGGGHRVL